jgi:hypothetical protein
VARYLAVQSVLGVVVAVVMAALMLAVDVAGVGSLIGSSGEPWIIGTFFAGTVFAIWPLVFATGVGLLSLPDSDARP